MRRIVCVVIVAITMLASLCSAVAGVMLGGVVLHPVLRPLTPTMVERRYRAFQQLGATEEDFVVRAPDGIVLRGWKVRPRPANGDWILLFHGRSDNRMGMLGQAELLLRHGYSVVMMDSRAHGESGGAMATYGWLERLDSHEDAKRPKRKQKAGLFGFVRVHRRC
jgi:hypothetical protein